MTPTERATLRRLHRLTRKPVKPVPKPVVFAVGGNGGAGGVVALTQALGGGGFSPGHRPRYCPSCGAASYS